MPIEGDKYSGKPPSETDLPGKVKAIEPPICQGMTAYLQGLGAFIESGGNPLRWSCHY